MKKITIQKLKPQTKEVFNFGVEETYTNFCKRLGIPLIEVKE